MEIEGVVLDNYFLRSDYTDNNIELILETQLFNGRREYIRISKDCFDKVFEQFSNLEEYGVGDILDFKGKSIKVVLETVDLYEDEIFKRQVLKPMKIKHFPRDEWIDL